MPELKRVVTTATPIEKVWAFLSDFSTTQTWDPGTVRCKRLDDGPVAVGSRFENVSTFKGREQTLVYAVTEMTAERRIVLTAANAKITSTDSIDFAPTPSGGTTVTYTANLQFKGIVALVVPFLKGALAKLGDDAQAGMTKALAAL